MRPNQVFTITQPRLFSPVERLELARPFSLIDHNGSGFFRAIFEIPVQALLGWDCGVLLQWLPGSGIGNHETFPGATHPFNGIAAVTVSLNERFQ